MNIIINEVLQCEREHYTLTECLLYQTASYALAKCDTQQNDLMIEDTHYLVNAMRKVLSACYIVCDEYQFYHIELIDTSHFNDNDYVLYDAILAHISLKILYALHSIV